MVVVIGLHASGVIFNSRIQLLFSHIMHKNVFSPMYPKSEECGSLEIIGRLPSLHSQKSLPTSWLCIIAKHSETIR